MLFWRNLPWLIISKGSCSFKYHDIKKNYTHMTNTSKKHIYCNNPHLNTKRNLHLLVGFQYFVFQIISEIVLLLNIHINRGETVSMLLINDFPKVHIETNSIVRSSVILISNQRCLKHLIWIRQITIHTMNLTDYNVFLSHLS